VLPASRPKFRQVYEPPAAFAWRSGYQTSLTQTGPAYNATTMPQKRERGCSDSILLCTVPRPKNLVRLGLKRSWRSCCLTSHRPNETTQRVPDPHSKPSTSNRFHVCLVSDRRYSTWRCRTSGRTTRRNPCLVLVMYGGAPTRKPSN
jgi:hypothetical protein